MAVGTLRCTVINVSDLKTGERFWSELTGLPVLFSAVGSPTPYSRLGVQNGESILLQLSASGDAPSPSSVHVDLTVEDIDAAIEATSALGAKFVRRTFYPPDATDPFLENAVMTDPFGNEFCLIKDLMLRRKEGDFVEA